MLYLILKFLSYLFLSIYILNWKKIFMYSHENGSHTAEDCTVQRLPDHQGAPAWTVHIFRPFRQVYC